MKLLASTSAVVPFASLGFALCIVFLPVFSAYGYLDDFGFVVWARLGLFELWDNPVNAMGRTLTGLFIYFAFGAVEQIADLAWIRALGLAGLLILLALCYRLLLRYRIAPWIAAAFSLLLLLSPGMVVWVGWASCAPYAPAAALAFYAGTLCLPTQRTRTVSGCARMDWHLPMAGCAILTALFFYQFAGFFFLLPLLLHLCAQRPDCICQLRAASRFCGLLLIALLLYLLLFKWAAGAIEHQTQRTALADDWLAKAAFLWSGPLRSLFTQWGAPVSAVAGWVCAAVLVLGWVAAVWPVIGESALQRVSFLLICVAALLTSMAPLILLKENMPDFLRMLTPAFSLVSAVAVFGLMRLPAGLRLPLCGLLAGTVLLAAGSLLRVGISRPATQEFQVVHAALLQLAESMSAYPEAIRYAPPPIASDPIFKRPPGHELGQFSSGHTWVTESFLRILVDQVFRRRSDGSGPLDPNAPFRVYTPAAASVAALTADLADLPHIDAFTPLAGPPTGTMEHPQLGALTVYANDTWQHPWLGNLFGRRFPQVHHDTLGWVHIFEPRAGNPVILVFGYGFFRADPDQFPLLTVLTDSPWQPWKAGQHVRIPLHFPRHGYQPMPFVMVQMDNSTATTEPLSAP